MTNGLLGDIECPVCQIDISHLRFSYERQQHVEQCLTSSTTENKKEHQGINQPFSFDDDDDFQTTTQNCDFDYCIFCGKCVTHLTGIRKDVHFSKCLDDLECEASNASYAGQSFPMLNNLDICPCCHEFSPLQNKSVRHKIKHMKQCMKQRNITIQQLLQKLQWIQWDYVPEQRRNNKKKNAQQQPLPPRTRSLQDTIVQATVSGVDMNDDDDDDFSTSVIIHKRTVLPDQQAKRTRQQMDPWDQDLELALALSKAEAQEQRKNKRHKVNSDATNVVSIDESRRLASLELQKILKQEPFLVRWPDRIETLPSSRIKENFGCYSDDNTLSLWKLASLDSHQVEDDILFTSGFMHAINEQPSLTTF